MENIFLKISDYSNKEYLIEKANNITNLYNRINEYIKKIEDNTLLEQDIDNVFQDIIFAQSLQDENLMYALISLKDKLQFVAEKISKHYNFTQEQMFFGDFNPNNQISVCPYVFILGNANFQNVQNAENVKIVLGNIAINENKLLEFPNLVYVGGNLDFSFAKIKHLDSLMLVGENINITFSTIESCKNLIYIGKNALFYESLINDLKQLQYIGGSAHFDDTFSANLQNLKIINNKADFAYSKNVYMPNLHIIKGFTDFDHAVNFYAPKLQEVYGTLHINQKDIHLFNEIKYAEKVKIDDMEISFEEFKKLLRNNLD